MKKILLLLSVLGLCCNYTYAQRTAAITFVNKDNVHDFGAIAKGNQKRYQFEIKNTGNVPVTITNMQINTGNFKFEWPKKPVKPNKKANIYVTCKPIDETDVGTFDNDILITSNATKQPYPFIHVSGTIIPTRGPRDPSKPQEGGIFTPPWYANPQQ